MSGFKVMFKLKHESKSQYGYYYPDKSYSGGAMVISENGSNRWSINMIDLLNDGWVDSEILVYRGKND